MSPAPWLVKVFDGERLVMTTGFRTKKAATRWAGLVGKGRIREGLRAEVYNVVKAAAR